MADDRDRTWQHPWLCLNVFLRESARPALKIEVNTAIAIRERMKRAPESNRRDGPAWRIVRRTASESTCTKVQVDKGQKGALRV